MKRKWGLLLGISVLLAGCSVEAKATVKGEASPATHLEKEIQMSAKQFEHELTLIDQRNDSVIQSLKPFDYTDETQYEEEMKALVKELASVYDQPMIPARISQDGSLIDGQSRVILDEQALLEQLTNVSVFDRVVELPITETEPNVSMETVMGLEEVVLGSYTTRFDPSVKGRTTNIALSAKEIDQIVLGPGDRFYFNLIVGDSTPDKGYQLATVIENKQFVTGYGGGICQTSSTLYNAVERAGLEIIELHHHSKEVGYVPKGKDATIAYGFKDFKFINNKDYPVVIKTIMNESAGTLEVQITSAGRFVAGQ
ncbi:VanW family protein [Bacillus sp. PS06]|uniref:VanW family protein n=1 Tax=Bacillus sp. PS06 TaxID=2764176 RepID=UPI00177BC178|nr:VanW family protein [Bacillus sp. PS06]MBD8071053.1 VanW family protein [Bacillus sp. PS06]